MASDCRILRKRKFAEAHLACNSQKVQGFTLWKIKYLGAHARAGLPNPQIILEAQIKQQHNQWTNQGSQYRNKYSSENPPIVDIVNIMKEKQ